MAERMDSLKNKGGMYHGLIRTIHTVLVGMKKNVILLIVCLLAGVLLMRYAEQSNHGQYKATFTVAYDELFRKIYGDRLMKINQLIKIHKTDKIATLLGVDIKYAKALNKVEGKNILGEDLSKDLNTDHIPFIVNITVDDSSSVIKLQNGIVNYLETGNEFFAERKKTRVLETVDELSYIDAQLKIIDSLNRLGGERIVPIKKKDGGLSEDGSLFSFSYELFKRKQELLRKQRSPSGLLVVDDAIVSAATNRSMLFTLAAGSLIGLLFFAIISGIIIPVLRYKD